MKSVAKAMTLLGLFSAGAPERGLSDIARAAGLDKATVLRLLRALARGGLVEQDPGTRRYRIGPGVLPLARLREASVPLAAIVRPVLARLAAETGETAHAAIGGGPVLETIGIAPGTRAMRVHLDAAETLHYHATASGIAWLAFAAPDAVDAVLGRPLPAFTAETPRSAATVRAWIGRARRQGYARADGTFEAEVVGIAAPFLGADGLALGAVAVASPISRMNEAAEARIARLVIVAAREIGAAQGAPGAPAAAEPGDGERADDAA